MKVLITGAAGFVGANLVRYALAAGHEPIAAIRPGDGAWRLDELSGQVQFAEVDLEDGEAAQDIVRDARPDVICHLAAHGAYSWQQDLRRMLAVNMYATDALLRAAVEIDARFVNTGSSSEYGYKDHPPSENEVVRPNSYYAVTKAAATQLCQLAADQHGLPVATLRLYSVYGPWEEPGRLMPTLVRSCRVGTWPPLVGRETARDFVWIDDACEAFLRAATAELPEPGAVFNIATGSQTTLERLVAIAADVFSVQEEPQWGTMQQRSWDTATWVGDPSRANSQLGWSASTPLDAGLARVGEWLGSHPEIEERYG